MRNFFHTFVSGNYTFQALVRLSNVINAENTHVMLRRRRQSFNNCSCSVSGSSLYGHYSALATFNLNYIDFCVMANNCVKLSPLQCKAGGCDVGGCHIPS